MFGLATTLGVLWQWRYRLVGHLCRFNKTLMNFNRSEKEAGIQLRALFYFSTGGGCRRGARGDCKRVARSF